jgi:pyruvate/2-oxoglutarate dehydrogenase complex dihydrolipoamide dehydrogenase (E3) component
LWVAGKKLGNGHMAKKFDAIIISTGQAEPSMAQRMTGEGLKVAIIERKLFGGTCVNVGCIPTPQSASLSQPCWLI